MCLFQLTSATIVKVLVEALGSRIALSSISSGVSPLALAFDISDSTARSLSDIPEAWMISDFALSKVDMVFLLAIQRCYGVAGSIRPVEPGVVVASR